MTKKTGQRERGQQPGPSGQHDPVGRLKLGARHLPAQYRDLITQDQQLDILGAAVPGELGQHLHQLAQQQVHQRRVHDPQGGGRRDVNSA